MFTFSSSPSPFNGDSTVSGTSGSTSSSRLFSYHPFTFPGGSTVTGPFGSTPAVTVASSSPSPFVGGSTVARTSGTFGSTQGFPVSASSRSLFSDAFTFPRTSVTASNSVFGTTFGSPPAFAFVSSSSSPLLGGSTVAGTSVTVPNSFCGATFGSTPAFTVASSSPSPLLGFSAFAKASPDVWSELRLSTTESPFNFPENFSSSNVSSSTFSSLSEKPRDSFASACFVVSAPSFSNVSSSTEDSATLGHQTSDRFTFPPASYESLSSSSVSPITGLTATTSSLCGEKSSSTSSQPQSTDSAPLSATVPAGCSAELEEVTAILASQCDKFLSGQAPWQSQGKEQRERQEMAPQANSSSKPVDDTAHAPSATAEHKYGEYMPCSVPMTVAPSTSTSSVPLGSKLGSLVPFHRQPAEEEQPYLTSIDLLNSSIEMWERVVGKKKTDQEVSDEGLRHFYEGINYFCLQYARLQEATAKYKDVAKANDNLEKMITSLEDKLAEAYGKLEYSEKEKRKLECKLARAENEITALNRDTKSLLRVQTLLHQKIFNLTTELEAGTPAIQKYKASTLFKQELMEFAAPYMGKGVKFAIEKIKAKDPTFDPKTYGLELYTLPPEADDVEFSPSDGGADQEHSEVRPSAAALALSPPVTSNSNEPMVLDFSGEGAKNPSSSA